MKKGGETKHYSQSVMKMKFIPDKAMPSLYIVMTGSAGILLHSVHTFAASTTTTFQATSTVSRNCTFNGTAQALAFGGYDPMATQPLDATSTFQIRCTKNTSVSIALNNGIYASGTQRRMSDLNNQFLNYQIYTNATRSTIWNSTNTVNLTPPSSTPQTLTVYGRIPAGQNVPGGQARTYADTITITATF